MIGTIRKYQTWLFSAWLILVILAFSGASALPATAATVENTTEVTVLPGPLKLAGLPANDELAFSDLRHSLFATSYSVTLKTFEVVDATGSGRGWYLTAKLVRKEANKVSFLMPYPRDLYAYEEQGNSVLSTSMTELTTKAQVVAHAAPGHGLGTFVVRGAKLILPLLAPVEKSPHIRIKFALRQN